MKITLLAWLAFLGIDFFVHGGLLARWYVSGAPFLLPPAQAFARIPVGYASFLLLAGLTAWLASRMGAADGRQGLKLGLALGSVLGAVQALGLVSVTTIDPGLAAGWGIALAVELAVTGWVVGRGLGSDRLAPLVVRVLVLVAVLVAATVALQSSGLAPAESVARPEAGN